LGQTEVMHSEKRTRNINNNIWRYVVYYVTYIGHIIVINYFVRGRDIRQNHNGIGCMVCFQFYSERYIFQIKGGSR